MLSKEQIEQIVQMTLAQLNKNCPAENQAGGNGWMFERAEDCIEAAQKAQKKLVAMTMEQRESLIAACVRQPGTMRRNWPRWPTRRPDTEMCRIKSRKFCWWQIRHRVRKILYPGYLQAIRE